MNDENDEYYSVARNNESPEVAGKWLELSIINISEVTHTIKSYLEACFASLDFSPYSELRSLYFSKQRGSPQEGRPHRTR